jgi:asparagine synthase (glutamine-hydrolysing)
MCGIAGFTGPRDEGLIARMVDVIRRRGPDGDGVFHSDGINLGHTRLAIVDLAGGVQPMTRGNGRYTVTYNGEIYNYDTLRARIEKKGFEFETTSDTEILPLGYAAFGVDLFKDLNGIFAFGLWDSAERKLVLVRDHFGVKPLFYAETRNGIVFSSSARAVVLHPDVDRSLNMGAIRDFLQYRYVPGGEHFFTGVKTLPPGCYLEWKRGSPAQVKSFWQPAKRVANGYSEGEWLDKTSALLEDAVSLQLRSDVPVGLFLSGGVDSSTIATFAARHCSYQMTAYTFSMGGEDDELEAARAIAERVGAKHVKVLPDRADDFSRLYDAVACMDSPVGDAIILPTYQLCEAAGKDLKVVLTGEGADEIFGGYVHFGAFAKLARLKRMVPFLDKLGPLVRLAPLWLLNRQFDYQASLGRIGRDKVSRMISSANKREAVYRLASSVIDDWDIGRAANVPPPPPAGDMDLSLPGAMLETMKTWLPYQILNKMDQLSMAHALEARVPFLDPRVYDLMAHAPDSLMLTAKENKVLLRRVLARQNVDAQRPKFAFHVPMEKRYKPSLEALCREWLSPDQIAKHGILKPGFVAESLADLDRGEFVASKRLVAMASLHMWLDANGAVH